MSSMHKNQFIPDYTVVPGDVLQEYLDDLGMTQAELSIRAGLAKKTINEIIKAKSPITPETALKLERILGRPAHFWSQLERQYQDDLARLADAARMQSHLAWLPKLPVNDMAKLGWIARHKDKLDQLEAILRFFGVSSPAQWAELWCAHLAFYRQTQHCQKSAEAISAWLRQGELRAQQMECAPYDQKHFQSVLAEIRGLTRDDPEVFVPKLTALCASAGVAVVFVPELPKMGVWGATRWIGGKAVLQLSLRYKSNDHLWFTFFHEAGHILKHGRKDIFIEGKDLDGENAEKEADAYARDMLIPPARMRQFLAEKPWSHASIQAFAKDIGIAPGIVVGRMQHDKHLPYNTHLNKLKISYRWKPENAQ
ncbi:MAG: HigA family addiction module antidote protein [Myxococcales bacterium]|nr:HigA family addiction module antidote protein [Myxococcales bacterium]